MRLHRAQAKSAAAAFEPKRPRVRTAPCIVCRRELWDAIGEPPDNSGVPYRARPAAAVMFTSRGGNYGSTVFDGGDETIQVHVCDRCLVEAASDGRVLTVVTPPKPWEHTEPWNPWSGGDEDEDGSE